MLALLALLDLLGKMGLWRMGFRFGGLGLLSGASSSNPRTRVPFKPQKSNRGTSSWQLKQYAEATLGSGSLRKAVKLPEGEDKDEWLAVNGEFYSPETGR
jgi:Mob1/phocein family